MGKIFIKSGGIGRASYHFKEPNDGVPGSGSYISYENNGGSWKTDDGELFPKKKFFEDVVYDRNRKSF